MNVKPEIEIILKLKGGHTEKMTLEEAKELRDILDSLVGKKEIVPYPYPYPYQIYPEPYRPWHYWEPITYCSNGTQPKDFITISFSDTAGCKTERE